MTTEVVIVGGGLAGSEAAWHLAQRGFMVHLYEMRPARMTGAHTTERLAELVCSNSFGSQLVDRASGLLQAEIKRLGSLLLDCAERAAVPAGGALAVDRNVFANSVTYALQAHPRIIIHREEVTAVPSGPTIIATGPLTSDALATDIARLTGQEYLSFFDAISPIVTADSIDMTVAFKASRHRRGQGADGDYINCPMNEAEYRRFVEALLAADRTPLRDFETKDAAYFERCLPIEELAARGPDTLAYGPMRPVGLRDPRTGKRPYAVVQLRQDNLAASLYNMVGFQTNIRWGQQEQVLRLIPGLEQAEFIRMGQMHRNTFINSPALLDATMQFRARPGLFFAGQITGVEGYVGNIATGVVAAVNMARYLRGEGLIEFPKTTMVGALCHYVSHAEPRHFQPMKANFGILPDLTDSIRNKRERYAAYAARALADLENVIRQIDIRQIDIVPVS